MGLRGLGFIGGSQSLPWNDKKEVASCIENLAFLKECNIKLCRPFTKVSVQKQINKYHWTWKSKRGKSLNIVIVQNIILRNFKILAGEIRLSILGFVVIEILKTFNKVVF